MLSGKAVATTKVIGSEVGTSFIEYKIEKKHEITRLRKNGYIKKIIPVHNSNKLLDGDHTHFLFFSLSLNLF